MFGTLRQLAGTETEYVEVGIVESALGGSKFKVNVRDKIFILNSAIEQPIFIGDQVVINKTQIGKYIVGVARSKKMRRNKVFVVSG